MDRLERTCLVILLISILVPTACQSGERTLSDMGNRQVPLKPVALIRGAGATFPYPVYSRWALRYFEETRTKLEYAQVGSQAGIQATKMGEVDFGATDIPLSPEELCSLGLLQFPMVIGAVVPIHHIPGVAPGELRLTGEILAKIYLGDITRWNDPTITAVNPDLPLPDEEIIPIHRSSASGTTWRPSGGL